MEANKSIQVAIAKHMWKLVRMAFKFLKRRITHSKRHLTDVVWKEYEFSCSNSPAVFLKKSRRWRINHNRYYYSVDEAAVAAAVQRIFDLLNETELVAESAAATPLMLPGFGGTPVRQLRVTDSPFPEEAKGNDEEAAKISKAAEDFISRFYGDLRRQKSMAAFETP